MEQAPKKRLSKGCMVGLIIAGVVFLLVAAFVVTAYLNRDEIARLAIIQSVIQIKSRVVENTDDSVDKDRFVFVADAFLEHMRNDSTNLNDLALFVQTVKPAIGDEDLDSDDLLLIEQAMMQLYPELGELQDTILDSSDSILKQESDSTTNKD